MRLKFILLLLGMALAVSADYEFKNFLDHQRSDLWSLNQPRFSVFFRKGAPFYSNDTARHELRYALSNRRGVLRFDGMVVYEALADFENDTLNRITLSIFSRGDGGHWDQGNVTYSLDKINAVMKQYYPDVKSVPEFYNMTGQKINGLNWSTPEGFYQLKWSMSGSKRDSYCEYFTLIIDKDKIPSLRDSARITVADKKDLLSNIRTDKKGYRYLEVPMVDQGMKGYCAVAVLERILRYYGSEVDQHQLAQLTNTGVYGTTRDDMLDAIKKADNRLGVKMRELDSDDSFFKIYDFLKMVDDYNRTAKKARRKTINPDDFKVVQDNYYSYNIVKLMTKMEPDIFVQSRCRDRKKLSKFIENVKKNIDTGVPIGWCVLLGLVPEKQKNPQPGGGHMRLIIGYSDANKEIVFTDSWGAKHEFKTMNYDEAWAMTTWLGVLVPRANNKL